MTPEWTTALPDWERRILAGESLIPPPLFPDEARAGLDVFKSLTVKDIAGSPTIGDSMRPWVLDFAASIFGAYDAETGRRLIREFFLLISKKNGKSTIAAGIMLTALLRNWRQSAEFYILAPTLEVANNSFYPARDMVYADPELREVLHVQENWKKITHRTTKAFLKVVAADAETVSGKKTTGLLIDEHWLFGKRANAASMLAEASGGLVSRPEGFVISLTTQSDDPPAGVFKDKLAYARAVRSGVVKDRKFLPVLYEFPDAVIEAKGYLEPQNWRVTNPNLGASVDEEWLADKLAEAQHGDKSALNVFLAKHLNVEIGMSLRSDRWAAADFWEHAAEPLTLEDLIRRCDVACIGLDGGGLDDLFGLAVIGRERGTGRWLGWVRAWAHRIVAEKRKSEASRLEDFARAGDLIWFGEADAFVPKRRGDAEAEYVPPDIEGIVAICKQVDEAGILHAVGLDPAGVGAVVDALSAAHIGSPEDEIVHKRRRVVGISQGFTLMRGIKTIERKVADGTFTPAEQPIMAWAVGNARCEQKANYVMISKAISGVGKIDPLMALFDAAWLMADNPEPPEQSIYTAERGLLVFG